LSAQIAGAGHWISAAVDNQAATPAKMLFTNNFQAACPEREQVRESG
jgi:hypothetical protein